ncbi:MAG: NAD(P)/FAD-dependent oxidoreductase [Clostridiales bacterium]|nr:NAD(P)/FAD-dependent oxidoreductase [Clostridiales bacterium]
MKQILVIGAGPAGLSAAYELAGGGAHGVTLLEASRDFGGISKTVVAGGNRMDIGGHRFFSKDARVTDWWAQFLAPQGRPAADDILLGREKQLTPGGADPETEDFVMLTRERVSRIYYKNAFFDYPVTLNRNTLRNMGLWTTLRAGFSYLAALIRKLPETNLENFYINRFGKVLYAMFFEGYTEKLWGRHPREISADWGAQRVKGLSVRAVLRDIFGKLFRVKNRRVETSLIERFSYPKYGPGQLWTLVANAVADAGGVVLTGKELTQIHCNEGGIYQVSCADGSTYPCDALVSSMPIADLVRAMGAVPPEIARIAEGLPYRDFQTVGLLLPTDKFLLRNGGKARTVGNIAPDCWIYVQDTAVHLGRIQIFNNWSPYMVQDFENTVWIGLEYFCDEGDEFWTMPDEGFTAFAIGELIQIGVIANAADVLATHRERVKKAYPAYFDTYAEFEILRAYLDAIPNLYCVGRNGQHRYNNMDHSMLTAFEAVECIIHDTKDKQRIWNVNTEAEYHEEKKQP